MVHDSIAGVARDGYVKPPASPLRDPRRAPAPLVSATAKLSRPRGPTAFVPRERLIHLLDAGSQRPVTLVNAGAGWGKTLLVSSWAEGGTAPGPVGWLSLDADDNSPRAFWEQV